MPALKVFVSSTCYDLTNVRDALRKFISSLGYDPVMSEYSDILYDPEYHTHVSCIKEVKNCDMLVLIIGGRFGGKAVGEAEALIDFEKLKEDIEIEKISKDDKFSITYLEVLKAIECGIPVYTFVKEDVLSEHKVYEKNKDRSVISDITFPSIEKQETARYIFEFINIVRLRNHGNNLFPFKKESDIEEILKKQWSSYFQKLLREQFNSKDEKNIYGLEKRVDELQSLVWRFIRETPRDHDFRISSKQIYGRILWVDDYPVNNETVISFFKEQNIQFDIALTTEQGLELYRRNLYDIIITDMGRDDEPDAGITLIKELKRLHCQVPIIVYSSKRALQKYGDTAMKLGAYKVIYGTADITSLITDLCGLKDQH